MSSNTSSDDLLDSGALLSLENAGERMVPELSGRSTFWEHVYRYAFASRFVQEKRVLDIACGEGYGATALRRAGASAVIGVDISEDACRHARLKYDLDARRGDAEQIPLEDATVDVVVSFETIEHVTDPLRFLDECARVLVPGGTLIISTPNKDVYSAAGRPNPYHCSEMREDEFLSALRTRFRSVKLYSQHPNWAPWWSVRALTADETPWNRFQLFQRLRRSAEYRLTPGCVSEPSPEQRLRVVDQILDAKTSKYSGLAPYAVHPRRRWAGERPFYFIAIGIPRARGRQIDA
jgi:SAM-dependent methyltransferase